MTAEASTRTLDALHLAAALELGADLEGFVTYDHRLAAACIAEGIDVRAPGRPGGWWDATPTSVG
jgi:predicted nucleic acid-binding protein